MNAVRTEGYSIGVDLGGTNLRIAACDARMNILDQIRLRTRLQDGPVAVVQDMCDAVTSLSARMSAQGAFAGLGIGTPGPLELPAGIVRNPPNLPGWDGLNLRTEIGKTIKAPVILECDANTAAFGEFVHWNQTERPSESLCMLTLGTGVGSGIVLDGKVWHGQHGMGGEAGHITVYPDGAPCGCGNRGCLESYASATAVMRMVRESAALKPFVESDPAFDAQKLAGLASRGNTDAQQVFERVGKAIGIALAGLTNIFDISLYLVGGGLIGAWDLFSPALFTELENRSYVYRLNKPEVGRPDPVRILPAKLGATSGLIGAAALPFYQN